MLHYKSEIRKIKSKADVLWARGENVSVTTSRACVHGMRCIDKDHDNVGQMTQQLIKAHQL